MAEWIGRACEWLSVYLAIASALAAALVPLTYLAGRVGRLRAPVYRHLLWSCCLLAVAFVPTLRLQGWTVGLAVLPPKPAAPAVASQRQLVPAGPLPAWRPTGPMDVEAPQAPAVEMQAPAAEMRAPAAPAAPVVSKPSKPFPALAAAAVGVWLAGVGVLLMRLGIAWRRIRRICREAQDVPAGRLDRLVGLPGVRARILVSQAIAGPVCIGIVHPAVLLPQAVLDGGDDRELAMVLGHELAHVQRRDCLVNLLQRIFEAVFFFHPLAWLASRQLTQAREQICDNHVLVKGVNAMDYAKLLCGIVDRKAGESLGAVALFEGRIVQRLRNLASPAHPPQTRLNPVARLAWAACACILFSAAGIVHLEARAESPASASAQGATSAPAAQSTRLVVLDAGHGGTDPGAPNQFGPPEKDINLEIALQVRDILVKDGVQVVMTRDSDTSLELDERGALVNRAQADLLVSIHAEASKSPAKAGAEVVVGREASSASLAAGQAMVVAIGNLLPPQADMVRDTRGLWMLEKTTAPAILVSTGYLTNKAESRQLSDKSYRPRMAAAIAKGVEKYLAATPAATQPSQATRATGKVENRVVDAAGKPVADAEILLLRAGPWYSGFDYPVRQEIITRTQSDADGRFNVVDPRFPLEAMVYAVARKHDIGFTFNQCIGVPTRDGKIREMRLHETGQLEGLVVDEAGQPIADAEVRADIFGGTDSGDPAVMGCSNLDWFAAHTGKDGRFVIPGVPTSMYAEFVVRAPGRATVATQRPSQRPDGSGFQGPQYRPGQKDVRIVLPPQCRIEGVALDESTGKPVAGVQLIAFGDRLTPPPIVTTDKDGRFVLDGLKAGRCTVALASQCQNYVTAPGEWVAEPVSAELTPGRTQSIQVELSRGAVVEVAMLDAVSGKPVEGVLRDVGVNSETGSVLADAKGIARIRLLPGNYRLSATERPRVVMPGEESPRDHKSAIVPVGVVSGVDRRIVARLESHPTTAPATSAPATEPVTQPATQPAPDAAASPTPLPQTPGSAEEQKRLMLAQAEQIWNAQNKVIKGWPLYAEVRDQLRTELLQEVDLDNARGEDLIQKSKALLQQFWDNGGDLSSTAYTYAFKSRILMEIVYQRDPKNMDVADELVQTILAAHPLVFGDKDQALLALFKKTSAALLEIRKAQFLQGKSEILDGRAPTWRDFVRAYDLAFLLQGPDNKEAKQVVTWLQQISTPAGCKDYDKWLSKWQESLDGNSGFGGNLYTTQGPYPDEFRYSRRLFSFVGPDPDKRGVILWGYVPPAAEPATQPSPAGRAVGADTRAFTMAVASQPTPSPAPQDSLAKLQKEVREMHFTGSGARAMELYGQASSLQGVTEEVWFKLGLALYDAAHYTQADDAFARTSMAAKPGSAEHFASLVWRGHLLDLQNRRPEALAMYRQALKVYHNNWMIHDQYKMTIDRKWAQQRLTTPFVRP